MSTSECKATTINVCELKHDELSLESTSFFSVRKQKCYMLQVDYKQGNISLLEMNTGAFAWRYLIATSSVFRGTYLRCKYSTTLLITSNHWGI